MAMATPGSLLVDPATSGVFHCVARCVRRAFLCGLDAYSGQNYEHRRGWVRERLRELAGLFAIEVHSYAVMSDHLHVVLRTLPGRAGAWGDGEVARRWLWLFPGKGGRSGQPPEESAIEALCQDRERLATCRARLADLSWFMRALNEPIARRANREDRCTGRFWEGRFKCQKLDDGGAVLACMAYVDLDPVRAGIAATPEESDFTTAQDRPAACTARRQLALTPQDPTPPQAQLIARARAESCRDQWLAPIGVSRVDGDWRVAEELSRCDLIRGKVLRWRGRANSQLPIQKCRSYEP
jgi:REP element-mobilizing transposase RayT